MRISHTYQFIFFAIPRTGSTTVRDVLDGYSDIRSVHSSERTPEHPFYHHISPRETRNIFVSRGLDWHAFKKFCVVRNPYDRVVSLYHHHQELKAAERGSMRLLRMAKELVQPTRRFKDYVMQIRPNKRLPICLQTFISDESGNSLVDDVLMYENLDTQLPAYLLDLGIRINASDIPHLNRTADRSSYRDYYDAEARERVSELYAYEIERFGYKF